MKARKPGRPRKAHPKQFETINSPKGTKADIAALAALLRKRDGGRWPATDTVRYAVTETLARLKREA